MCLKPALAWGVCACVSTHGVVLRTNVRAVKMWSRRVPTLYPHRGTGHAHMPPRNTPSA